jgi:DNA-binding LytR/AlgR family response regulator
MNVLVIEDELLAAERLQLLLKEYDSTIEVMACLDSIEATVEWLQTKPHPDLLLLDIHLSDGASFDIFKQVSYNKPVIFITAYDHYALDAFRLFSIDYILKPVSAKALASAMEKFRRIAGAFSPVDYRRLTEEVHQSHTDNFKSRFLARVGQRMFFIEKEEIAYFSADNKIVYLVDREGNRYVVDYTLEKLEALLDPKLFFRLNRKIIISSGAIRQVKPYPNSRLKLILRGAPATEEMVVSRERVAEFKAWADS